jgi:hypothetical protein
LTSLTFKSSQTLKAGKFIDLNPPSMACGALQFLECGHHGGPGFFGHKVYEIIMREAIGSTHQFQEECIIFPGALHLDFKAPFAVLIIDFYCGLPI